MDPRVLAAMARWPDVPEVHGWLRLDRRGRWWIRETCIDRPSWIDFIGRNYAADDRGAWYFQNGPQRVYATLDYAPWVLGADDEGHWRDQAGQRVAGARLAALDEEGSLVLLTDRGAAAIDGTELERALSALATAAGGDPDAALAAALAAPDGADTELVFTVDAETVPVVRVDSASMPVRFGFRRRPRAGNPAPASARGSG